ncbi:MAG: 6,7-dimethyl-8-ribityllumazine synthase [Alphaproteobacteria bacterium]|nr:MAG: 6,7-dimethyl-8-ribityllumazine synthase [Alphaproteobacteria bacterium]
MHSPHILILEARFYRELSDSLAAGAIGALTQAGASYERMEVPGCFELPAALKIAATGHQPRPFDGYLALGVVIRGETSHYDYVCDVAASGLNAVALEHRLALGFGVLTCETGEQAWARADPNRKNKGAEAARAVLRMIDIRCQFQVTGA